MGSGEKHRARKIREDAILAIDRMALEFNRSTALILATQLHDTKRAVEGSDLPLTYELALLLDRVDSAGSFLERMARG